MKRERESIHIHARMYVCMYVHTCVCMYVYIYIHIYVNVYVAPRNPHGKGTCLCVGVHTSAYVSKRQHTSVYVSITKEQLLELGMARGHVCVYL